jgi:hypothetical protein
VKRGTVSSKWKPNPKPIPPEVWERMVETIRAFRKVFPTASSRVLSAKLTKQLRVHLGKGAVVAAKKTMGFKPVKITIKLSSTTASWHSGSPSARLSPGPIAIWLDKAP